MNTEELNKLGTAELRDLIRKSGCRETWVASARKADCLAYLASGTRPAPVLAHQGELTMPQASQAPQAPQQAPTAETVGQLMSALAALIPSPGVDIETVREIVRGEMESAKPLQIVIDSKPGPTMDSATVHPELLRCIKLLRLGLPVLLVGPAGSGKTTLAKQIAEAMGLRFSQNSLSGATSEASIVGATMPGPDGQWTFRPASFTRAYMEGGVHLLDEIDAADPNMLVYINSALANRRLAIPREGLEIEQHPDCYLIAAANTFGNGASRQYCGRNALDGSTVDRFALSTIVIEYDTAMESALIGSERRKPTRKEYKDNPPTPEELHQWAEKIRAKIEKAGLRRILSTRTLLNAAKLAANGFTMEEIKDLFFVNWSSEERARVE